MSSQLKSVPYFSSIIKSSTTSSVIKIRETKKKLKNNQILIKFKFISYKVSVSVSGNAISSTKISFLKYSKSYKHVKAHSCVFLRVSQVQQKINIQIISFIVWSINARIFLIFGLRLSVATSVTMENFRQLINSVARQNMFLNDFHCFLYFQVLSRNGSN